MSQPDGSPIFSPPPDHAQKKEVSLSSDIGVVGRDGWVFLGNQHSWDYNQALGCHEVAAEHVDRLAEWVRGMGDFSASRGIPFLFAVAPAKWAIYDDKLELPAERRPSLQDQLLERLADRDDVLDLRPPLRAARARADTYSPLNSHWTDFGAAIAWRAIAAHLSRAFPGETFDPFEGEPDVDTIDAMNECRELMGIEGPNPWTLPIYPRPLPEYDFITRKFDRLQQLGLRQADLLELPMQSDCQAALTGKRALIFRDSTGTQLSPFLTSTFRQSFQFFHMLAVWPDCPPFPSDLGLRCAFASRVEAFKPDVILYVTTERYLAHSINTGAYWSAQKAFDSAPDTHDYCWPMRAGHHFLRFDADLSLAKPVLLDFSDLLQDESGHVLRVRLSAKGAAALCFGFTYDNQPCSEWFWLEPGSNVIYFRVPTPILLGHFWIARHEQSAEVMLSELTVRPC